MRSRERALGRGTHYSTIAKFTQAIAAVRFSESGRWGSMEPLASTRFRCPESPHIPPSLLINALTASLFHQVGRANRR